MTSNIHPLPSAFSGDDLDQLFLDCADLEQLVASIRQAIDKLGPAVDSGLVTTEHLMNLAFRIENTEQGLIAIAHQIGDTATTVIDRRRRSA
ncbi:MAG: hypothetical protein ACR2RF_26870 [Geminicoccaceae bacterium]